MRHPSTHRSPVPRLRRQLSPLASSPVRQAVRQGERGVHGLLIARGTLYRFHAPCGPGHGDKERGHRLGQERYERDAEQNDAASDDTPPGEAGTTSSYPTVPRVTIADQTASPKEGKLSSPTRETRKAAINPAASVATTRKGKTRRVATILLDALVEARGAVYGSWIPLSGHGGFFAY